MSTLRLTHTTTLKKSNSCSTFLRRSQKRWNSGWHKKVKETQLWTKSGRFWIKNIITKIQQYVKWSNQIWSSLQNKPPILERVKHAVMNNDHTDRSGLLMVIKNRSVTSPCTPYLGYNEPASWSLCHQWGCFVYRWQKKP